MNAAVFSRFAEFVKTAFLNRVYKSKNEGRLESDHALGS